MQADFALDYDIVTLERPQTLYLMARFVSGPAPQAQQRRPLNISLVIDRSGSMAGAKIDYTRQAAQFLAHQLGAKDTFSIVLYNDTVTTLLSPEKVRRKDVINQRIVGIKAGGSTNLSGGWLEGCRLAAQNRNDDWVNRVILMTDGLANVGVTDTDQLVTMARQKYADGVSTTTMGLGQDFKEDLLMAMADAGGGAFYFIESPEVAPIIFQEELQGLLSLVGQNLVISVISSDQVAAVKQLNAYPTHTEGINTTFRLGDIFGEEIKTLLLELSIPALKNLGQQQIATLRFEYDELLETGVTHHETELPVVVHVAPEGQLPASPNPAVEQPVLLLKAAQARRSAVAAADSGNFDTAAQILRQTAEMIEKTKLDSPEIKEERDALLQEADAMAMGEEQYAHTRKSVSTSSLYTMTDRHDQTRDMRAREGQRRTQHATAVPPEKPEIERREGVMPTYVTWRGQTFLLDRDLVRLGRAEHNEIVIQSPNVSRFHCQIKREKDELILEDVGSTNGTIMNGLVLKAPHTLCVGDVAYLCDEKLVFHDGTL